jgi:hypothetical protein
VCTLAEATQTRWFLFLGKLTGRLKGALLEEWMEIERKAALKWRLQNFAAAYVHRVTRAYVSQAAAADKLRSCMQGPPHVHWGNQCV